MDSGRSRFVALLAVISLGGCQSLPINHTILPVKNPGFEATQGEPPVPDWILSEHASATPGTAYEIVLDKNSGSGSPHALRITRLRDEIFGWAHQVVPISPTHVGKALNFSARVKTEAVGAEGWLLIVNMNKRGQILKQFRSEPVTGTTDWQRISLKAPIPADTTEIDLGFILLDGGTAWGDDAEAHIE